jgi:hypothetical protein
MERMQDFIARARARKVHPGEKLLEMADWTNRLDQIFGEFNADVQNGKMNPGCSPAEAWQAGLHWRPLRQLPAESRYLLATHCKRVRVRQEGIVLTVSKNRMLFCNEQTGKLIGQDVLAYYNLEFPGLLTVSDLTRQNYFTVKAISLPALSATKEQFAAVHSQIAGHTKAARAIYGGIGHPLVATIARDTHTDPATAELGRFHNEEMARFKEEQTAATRTLGKIQRRAAAAGVNLGHAIRNPDRVLRGLEAEREILARIAAKEQAAAIIRDAKQPATKETP